MHIKSLKRDADTRFVICVNPDSAAVVSGDLKVFHGEITAVEQAKHLGSVVRVKVRKRCILVAVCTNRNRSVLTALKRQSKLAEIFSASLEQNGIALIKLKSL